MYYQAFYKYNKVWSGYVCSFNKTPKSAKNILFKRIYNLYIINADILLIFNSNIFMAFPILLHAKIDRNNS